MCYSPSARTAWESVYFIQHEIQGGWLLRGIHHFMAQAMIVLLLLHLLQVVICGAYRAPRELNFWTGLVLLLIVFGLGLTGYLLPWDQKGYWATAVATNLAGIVPLIGEPLQKVAIGGSDYGHHTLTRFFALHAGVLPALLMAVTAVHIFLFRKHGIKTPDETAPPAYFWPDQILKDAVACLAVLVVVLLLCTKGYFQPHEGLQPGEYLGAHLSPPADPSESYAAARPEWYFLFLFEGLKYFNEETMGPTFGNEFFGAIVAPSAAMAFLFLMPIIGKWKLGHGFNIAMLICLLIGAGLLTAKALDADYYSQWHGAKMAADAPDEEKQLHQKRIQDSLNFLAAKAEAEAQTERLHHLIQKRGGIPIDGAISLMQTDPELQGPKLFTKHCASCHPYTDSEGHGIAGPAEGEAAPNLFAFATRDWLAKLMDPETFASREYFGATAHGEDLMMGYMSEHVAYLNDEGKEQMQKVVAALSAEAKLKSQTEQDAQDEDSGLLDEGRDLILTPLAATEDVESEYSCTDCHKFRDEGDLGSAPDLTGYGSEAWLFELISNVEHERFYESNNDRMPVYYTEDTPDTNRMSADEVRLLVRWLRGDER